MKQYYQALIFACIAFVSLQSFTLKNTVDKKTVIGYSQGDDDEQKRKEHREKWEKALGSFQFQIINSRLQPSINVSIIDKIESKRHQTDTTYIKYSDEIRIMILPVKVIKGGDYKKLEFIRYISQN